MTEREQILTNAYQAFLDGEIDLDEYEEIRDNLFSLEVEFLIFS